MEEAAAWAPAQEPVGTADAAGEVQASDVAWGRVSGAASVQVLDAASDVAWGRVSGAVWVQVSAQVSAQVSDAASDAVAVRQAQGWAAWGLDAVAVRQVQDWLAWASDDALHRLLAD